MRITRIMPTSREDLRLATGRVTGARATGDHRDQPGPIARGAALTPVVARRASLATPGWRSLSEIRAIGVP
jgi:hypothetical protein